MKTLCCTLSRLVLALCLAIYGPASVALAGENGAVAFVEICADGAVQTIAVDADGAPVEEGGVCLKCLTCCSLHLDTLEPDVQNVSARPVPADPLGGVRQHSVTHTHFELGPMPRGPPARRIPSSTKPDHGAGALRAGLDPRCDGRPILQDAVA
ncbi:hypothetical protein [Marivita sp. GX14005]|uniref:hypothetical protein n=1 Tax=Marivita sp. GX14005 TaxID=2942276 RepID=UPI002018A3D9|nr:hypothetical protein [Marivita sp. GX14005]MCL3881086.1 hypothetical protein [Marivita sp. GX14005]